MRLGLMSRVMLESRLLDQFTGSSNVVLDAAFFVGVIEQFSCLLTYTTGEADLQSVLVFSKFNAHAVVDSIHRHYDRPCQGVAAGYSGFAGVVEAAAAAHHVVRSNQYIAQSQH